MKDKLTQKLSSRTSADRAEVDLGRE